ncbi:hypothetical protein glysoja_024422 [Glycine soja]|uniref:Uncharacterized protein n=1 Tax=Glycine soja TaxID=3848 RepID=A0A0B2SDN5_GLYSO|nr:hypothetical protein glysoja_024422 [Glycine soja]
MATMMWSLERSDWDSVQLTSPSTDAEVELALRVLERCCLLHPQSTAPAHQHNAIQVRCMLRCSNLIDGGFIIQSNGTLTLS